MTTAREPIHTVYVGAHLFTPTLAADWSRLALAALATYAPDARALGAAVDHALDDRVYARVRDKLGREPVEDLRIDFEDGFGDRSDQEEDAAARQAAEHLAGATARGAAPAASGVRIKPLDGERGTRAARTLELFMTTLLQRTGGTLPGGFAVTLPKVTGVAEVTALARLLEGLEGRRSEERRVGKEC